MILTICYDPIIWSTGSDIPKLESTLNSALVILANWCLENDFKALATVPERYPDQDWLHVFTDGSATASFGMAGVGAFLGFLILKNLLVPSQTILMVVLQWIPSYCGIHANEQIEELTKDALDAASTLPSNVSSKRQGTSLEQISTEENFNSLQILAVSKSWSRLLDGPKDVPQISALPRMEGVVCFQGHHRT
ncbi:hypothetical protein TNCV_858411 [Trichonephila clavipes]|nr:hypothetical protein TNCV_858411 [Trichonephila clavipes]